MKHEFKVGDKVIITKSNKSWNQAMDIYDGTIVEIINLREYNNEIYINFKNGGSWVWQYTQGHFKPLLEHKIYELW